MAMFKSISLADQVFEKLESDIISGVYPRGEVLTELKLVEQRKVSTDEHKAICEAICAGNEDEAERLMCEHIQNAKKSMIERFSQNGEYNR